MPTDIAEQVLQHWSTGAPAKAVAEAAAITRKEVEAIVARARRCHDPRAKSRYVRGRKDGRSQHSKGIYRTRAQCIQLTEDCLNRWSAGEGGGAIAADYKISRGYLDSILSRARNRNDQRACRRRI